MKKRKMKSKMNSQKEDFDLASIEDKPTPKYDAKSQELKKLIGATRS